MVSNACHVGLPGEQAERSECFLKTQQWSGGLRLVSKDRCAPSVPDVFYNSQKAFSSLSALQTPARALGLREVSGAIV